MKINKYLFDVKVECTEIAIEISQQPAYAELKLVLQLVKVVREQILHLLKRVQTDS